MDTEDSFRCCRHCRHRQHSRTVGGHFTPCMYRPGCKGSRPSAEVRPVMMRLAALLNLFPIR